MSIYANQPGAKPFKIPESVPNPATVPRPEVEPRPVRRETTPPEPVKVPEKVAA